MKKDEIDWSVLKGSLIIFSICLIISTTFIVGSYYFNNSLNKQFNKNKNIFQSISSRYLDVDQEEKLLHDYYPEFVQLYEAGIIGREKRLDWIESLRQSGEKIGLVSLNYSIASQEEFIPEFMINYTGYKLYRSNMDLDVGLLHEADFFKLLDYLNRNVDGSYTISECEFRLNGDQIKFEKDHANISASCLLQWLTIDLADGRRIEI